MKSENGEVRADKIHTARDTAVLACCLVVAGTVSGYIIRLPGMSFLSDTMLALFLVPFMISLFVKTALFVCILAFNLSLTGSHFLWLDSGRPSGEGAWELLFSMAILFSLVGLLPAAKSRRDYQRK